MTSNEFEKISKLFCGKTKFFEVNIFFLDQIHSGYDRWSSLWRFKKMPSSVLVLNQKVFFPFFMQLLTDG